MMNSKFDASLAGTAGYIKNLRNRKNIFFLLDNGDNLQGQPTVYYYNFIDTISPHLAAEAFNYLRYDAGTVGNHDIEAGHAVYDRLIKEYNFPLLAANAVDKKSGKQYFNPYIKENPDLIIGLFHSGWNWQERNSEDNKNMNENGSASVAYEVPGFDIIFI